jgi:hypothetical protein
VSILGRFTVADIPAAINGYRAVFDYIVASRSTAER